MKIAVYAICKNESAFAAGWMESMAEADAVVVLDTGSTDGTAEKLRALGARVTVEAISPWRFDRARNRSLDLVPADADICVCTDLDERFRPGWRQSLEQAWRPGCSQARYRYTWSFQPDGREGLVFWQEKIHARRGFVWAHPVHEVLRWTGPGEQGPVVTAAGVQLDHFPDRNKPRGQYLPLLELSVQEDPLDDRNLHYLGREYMYYGRWADCIRTLERHLELPTAAWADERAASMRYIARAQAALGRQDLARDWYLRAIAQAPWLREAYVDLAFLLYRQAQWEGVLYFTGCALALTERPRSYICEAAAWGALPYDLRSIALSRTGRQGEALAAAEQAAALAPWDSRIQGNVQLLRQLAG